MWIVVRLGLGAGPFASSAGGDPKLDKRMAEKRRAAVIRGGTPTVVKWWLILIYETSISVGLAWYQTPLKDLGG